MSLWDTFMSDTVGVLYRAGTGKVDPWSQNEIVAQGTKDCISAGGDPTTCAQNAQSDTTAVLNKPSMSYTKAFTQSFFPDDDGSGCHPSNPNGCSDDELKNYLLLIGLGIGAIVILWLIRPFAELAEG